jgi:hypothetical protein
VSEPDDWLDPDYLEGLKAQIAGDYELRLLLEVAFRVGLPLSEVQRRWTALDLAMEVAFASLRADEELRRCPRCGVDADAMLDAGNPHTLGEHFAYRLEVRSCQFCNDRDELAAKLTGEPHRTPPPIVRYVVRQGDEPFVGPEHQFGAVIE